MAQALLADVPSIYVENMVLLSCSKRLRLLISAIVPSCIMIIMSKLMMALSLCAIHMRV